MVVRERPGEGRHAPAPVGDRTGDVAVRPIDELGPRPHRGSDTATEIGCMTPGAELGVELGSGRIRVGRSGAGGEQEQHTGPENAKSHTGMVRRAPETPGTVPSVAGTLAIVFPVVRNVPAISTDQMIEVDRVMIEDLGIDLVRMMENAGRSLAALAIALHAPRTVQVLAGSGGNGGGVLAAARHLWNRGVDVRVAGTSDPDRLTPVAAQQAHILGKVGVEFSSRPTDADLVLDGLIGYSLSGAPRGRALELIDWSQGRTVLSLDVPSGVDSETGDTPGAAVRATATLTLALPKTGIVGHDHTGRLFLADISVPPQVYRAFGIDLETPFRQSPIVELV